MKLIILFLSILFFNSSYFQPEDTISNRFQVPEGYKRMTSEKKSFGFYLQNLPLKEKDSPVRLFNGQIKSNKVHEAVIDLPIGDADLHQCADAVMRLRAEYLFYQKKYNEIQFKFTNGMSVPYSKWKEGYRIKVKGNKTSWVLTAKPSVSYITFWKYLQQIFMYAGTASLSKELKPKSVKTVEIGDVFIKGGFPGHAVIVVDLATNVKGEKIVLLAQSYMPAQELHVLKNFNSKIGPWYNISESQNIITPEWTFSADQLKSF